MRKVNWKILPGRMKVGELGQRRVIKDHHWSNKNCIFVPIIQLQQLNYSVVILIRIACCEKVNKLFVHDVKQCTFKRLACVVFTFLSMDAVLLFEQVVQFSDAVFFVARWIPQQQHITTQNKTSVLYFILLHRGRLLVQKAFFLAK